MNGMPGHNGGDLALYLVEVLHGPDGIIPTMLQHGIQVILPWLEVFWGASIALRYVPNIWRSQNPGRTTSDDRSYRPSILTSFLQNTLEIIIGNHLLEGPSTLHPWQPPRKKHWSPNYQMKKIGTRRYKINPGEVMGPGTSEAEKEYTSRGQPFSLHTVSGDGLPSRRTDGREILCPSLRRWRADDSNWPCS